ncbi:MAG TPA: hypothetical protein VF803_02185 [Candidatus Paceibacterota bacterium]
MPLTLGLAMLVSATLGSATQTAAADASAVPLSTPAPQTVQQRVRLYFAGVPILAEIARCESKFRQYDADGNVLRGQVHTDVGVMQVNEYYHGEEAKKLGYDLYTLDGNMAYARYLYEREGTTPWLSSSYCWMNRNATSTEVAMNFKSSK